MGRAVIRIQRNDTFKAGPGSLIIAALVLFAGRLVAMSGFFTIEFAAQTTASPQDTGEQN